MDNCCDSLLNKLLCVFNFFFFITGAALIGMGTYIHVEMSDYLNYLDDSYVNASILFIVLGTIILILGFFGCCGACTESPCMMFTFGALLSVVVIVEIGAAIAVYMFRADAHSIITAKMKEGMTNYDNGTDFKGVTDTWNAVQSDFQCCGVTQYTDWKNTTFSERVKGVPDSCCKIETTECGKDVFASQSPDPSKINPQGCLYKLEKYIIDNITLVGGIGIGIAILQIIGVLLSCMLAGSMRRRAGYV